MNVDEFWQRVDKTPSCWLWTGALGNRGYGRARFGGRVLLAHRVAWELTNGPIPEGLQLDHACRIPRCVNPFHLEPVTNRENTRRGVRPTQLRNKDTCRNGLHPWPESAWEPISPHGHRQCIECARERSRRRRQRERARKEAQ